jgi:hypothetical protein
VSSPNQSAATPWATSWRMIEGTATIRNSTTRCRSGLMGRG